MTDILENLRGGDLRSIGQANEVAHEIEKNPALFGSVFNGLYDSEPVVRMRSADVIEKVTKNKPELLSGYTSKVIPILAFSKQQEVCWHMAQVAPRLECTAIEENEIIEVLKKYLLHKSKIVIVCAMESLAIFAERDSSILHEIIGIIKRQKKKGSPAVQSRGQKLLQRLERKQRNVKT